MMLIRVLFSISVRFHGLRITPSTDGSCNAEAKILSISAVNVDMILSLPFNSSSKLGKCSPPLLSVVGFDRMKRNFSITFWRFYSNDQLCLLLHSVTDHGESMSKHFFGCFFLECCNGSFDLFIAI